MAAVTVNSVNQTGDRSVSFDITVGAGGAADTFDFSTAAAALSLSTIKTFLTTSHTSAAGTAAAFAANGVVFSVVGTASAAAAKFSGNNVIDGLATGQYSVRFALAHSISA